MFEQTINEWARENDLELGEAIYAIVRYIVENPLMISSAVRSKLLGASEQELIEAMEAVSDDLEENDKISILS